MFGEFELTTFALPLAIIGAAVVAAFISEILS